MKTAIKTLIFTLIAFSVFGCASTSYRPPEGSNYGQIRAKGDRKGLFNWNQIEILTIDGTHVGMLLYGGQYYKAEEGRRRIRVSYRGNRSLKGNDFLVAGPIDLYADIENGLKYEVAGEYTDEKVTLFIREVKSGDIVSEKIEENVRYERINTTTTIPIFIPTN